MRTLFLAVATAGVLFSGSLLAKDVANPVQLSDDEMDQVIAGAGYINAPGFGRPWPALTDAQEFTPTNIDTGSIAGTPGSSSITVRVPR